MRDRVADDLHVVPVNDLREHATSHDCWCSPTEDDGVWIHHSMDRREYTIERGIMQ